MPIRRALRAGLPLALLGGLLPVRGLGAQDAGAQAPTGLERYDLSRPAVDWRLPRRIEEISGLAFSADGRLYAHDDERAVIYEIDYRNGELTKAWALGETPVRGDFEGIAVVGDRVWLVNADGWLFEGPIGDDDERLLYNAYGTGVGQSCEVEGLVYEPRDDTLLLLCKNPRIPALEGIVAIYRWSLARRRMAGPPIRIRRSEAGPELDDADDFRPSGIERDPATGNYLVIAARDQYIAEIRPDGSWVSVRRLDRDRHEQPEGIALGRDGTLFIADEARRGRARLTLYAPLPAGGR